MALRTLTPEPEPEPEPAPAPATESEPVIEEDSNFYEIGERLFQPPPSGNPALLAFSPRLTETGMTSFFP